MVDIGWNEYKEAGCRWVGGMYVIPNYKTFNAIGARFSTFEKLRSVYPTPIQTTDLTHVETSIRKERELKLASKTTRNRVSTDGMFCIEVFNIYSSLL